MDDVKRSEGRGKETKTADSVNHPAHYQLAPGIEAIDVIRAVTDVSFAGYCRGNVLKYLLRADHKGGVEDLKKARVYLDWEIEVREAKSRQEENAETPNEDRPTVIRCINMLTEEDFQKWAEKIKGLNDNVICIPCDAEVVEDEIDEELYESERYEPYKKSNGKPCTVASANVESYGESY